VKECAGVKKTCIVRATFVIDKKGRLRHALHGVTPRGHAMDVLRLVRQINSECRSTKTR
jgi:thioredoxin-dependent peroxiredoxin